MPRLSIDIADEQDRLPIDEARLREVVERTLEMEQVAAAEISVAVVDDATIHELNREHLGHDYPTDVLSFPLGRTEDSVLGTRYSAAPRSPEHTETLDPRLSTLDFLEGEIVVSAQTALRRAGEFGWSPADETVLYVVHGLLHLAGYDDRTDEERSLMRSRERAILATWNLSPRYGDHDREDDAAPEGADGTRRVHS